MAKKIVVIDDEDLITASLQKLLSRQGYDVVIAQKSSLALQKVKETDFDLIISDVRMPEMDGIETLRQIRAYLQKSNKKLIPEILITGYADLDKYEKAMDLKVAEYVYKPFDNAGFLQVVKKIFK
jgi:CheY-like chemotaxis protein